MSPDNNLIEMIEIKDHPYFVASQFHPEFKSRPWDPHQCLNILLKLLQKKIIPQKKQQKLKR